MSSIQQRAELQAQIWKIANDVRGSIDGWDFKQYVLGTLFYRFISENFANYIEGGDDSVNYATLSDAVITPEIKDDATKTKGYFIYPSQLFANIAADANTNGSLNTDLAAIFSAIESSAKGYPSEMEIKGLFADFDTTSNRLCNTVKDKNSRLAAVLKGVAELNFGEFQEVHQLSRLLSEDCRGAAWNVTKSLKREDINFAVRHYVGVVLSFVPASTLRQKPGKPLQRICLACHSCLIPPCSQTSV